MPGCRDAVVIEEFLLKARRAETPFYRFVRKAALAVRSSRVPMPRVLHPAFRLAYHAHQVVGRFFCWLVNRLYREPLFWGRCESVGARFDLYSMPFVVGQAEIHIGTDVTFSGQVDIFSGRVFDHPKLVIGHHAKLGHGVVLVVNREVVIEDGVLIAGKCTIADSDGHPLDSEKRARGLPPSAEDIKPVRICRNAWLAEGCQIRKGVTIGEGAVVGCNSVVLSSIPPYCIAMGNPARVVGFAAASPPVSHPGGGAPGRR